MKCPRLLADKILVAFPHRNIKRENLRIIKLSYSKYIDQSRGQLDVSKIHFLTFSIHCVF